MTDNPHAALARLKERYQEGWAFESSGQDEAAYQVFQQVARDALRLAEEAMGHTVPCVRCGKAACTREGCPEPGHSDSCELSALHGWVCSAPCWEAVAALTDAAPSAPIGIEPGHPEAFCERCGGPNAVWFAPSPLWNRVVGSPNGVWCPLCFIREAERIGAVKSAWKLEPEPAAPSATAGEADVAALADEQRVGALLERELERWMPKAEAERLRQSQRSLDTLAGRSPAGDAKP